MLILNCKLFFLAFAISYSPITVAQGLKVTSSLYLGSFNMHTSNALMDEAQVQLQENYDLPFKKSTPYPANIGFQIEILSNRSNRNWQFGGFISIISTGTRIGYSDYSGSFYFDNLVNCLIVGMMTETQLIKKDKNKLIFKGSVGYSFINNEYTTNIHLTEDNAVIHHEIYNPINLTIEPSLKYERSITNRIGVYSGVGFLIDLSGNYFSEDPENQAVISPKGDGPKVEMTGFRVHLGLTVLIF